MTHSSHIPADQSGGHGHLHPADDHLQPRPDGRAGRRRHRTVRSAGRPRSRSRGAAHRHRSAVSLDAVGVGLGERLLRRGGAGGITELEGVPLRLTGREQRDHRRQTAGVPVADGPLGTDLRSQLLEHPGASGVARSGHGGGAVRVRPAHLRSRRRVDRRGRARADAGRGADVPVQQPGCPVDLPAHRRRILHPSRRRESQRQVAGGGRRAGRIRLPDQDAAGVPGATGAGDRVSGGGADLRSASSLCTGITMSTTVVVRWIGRTVMLGSGRTA